ncbi:MAG: hypothetical protein JXB34_07295 [Bacteroidales bacterium]|nr:hypothetical protein [Bacteroidales bacterium]
MKAGTIHILDLDFEFKLWKNRLYHFQSELEIIFSRIFVLTREHPAYKLPDIKLLLLNDQKERARYLLNKIENLEQEMSLYAEDYPINEKHIHYISHEAIRKEMAELDGKQQEIINIVISELCYPKVSGKL